MAEDKINSVIDEPRIKAEFDRLYNLLSKAKDLVLEINNSGRKIGLATGLNESVAASKRASGALDELTKVKNRLILAETEYGRKLAEARVQLQEQNRVNKEAAQQSLGLVDAYKKLVQQYNEASRTAKNLAVTQGINSAAAKEAAARANDLHNQLKAIDASVGQYQRNVGNYSSATFALSQILREAPAFAFNLQTGLLAISNNMPILIDEFNKLSRAIDESTGKQVGAIGALGQLTKSLFSWTNLLTIGISVVTIFGKEIAAWVADLFKGRQEIERTAESQRILNDSLKESSGAYQTAVQLVNELKINIELAKNGFISKEKVIRQYNESIGETTGEVKNLDEAERELVKNGDAYIQMMLLKAAANLALEEAAKQAFQAEQDRRKDLQEFISFADRSLSSTAQFGGLSAKDAEKLRQERGAARQREAVKEAEDARKTYEDIAKKFQQDAAAIAKKYDFDFFGDDFEAPKGDRDREKLAQDQLKALLESQKTALETAAQGQQAIFENEQENYDKRIAAAESFTLIQNAIARKQREIDVVEAGKVTNKKLEAEEAYRKASEKNEIERVKNIREIAKSAADEETRAIIATSEQRQAAIAEAEDRELSRLSELYRQGTLSKEQYEAAKLQVQNKYANESLNAEAEFIQKIIDLQKLRGLPTEEAEKKLADIRNKIRDTNLKYEEDRLKEDFDLNKEYLDKKLELERQHADRVKAFRQQIFDFAVEIGNSLFEREKNQIQEQIDLVDEQEQKEIEAVENSTKTEQQKADEIAVIQATAQARKEALERKQREIDARAGQFQKMMSLLQIGVTTAQTIFQLQAAAAKIIAEYSLIPGGGALGAALSAQVYAQIPIVIAAGAVQAAAIAAKPIPRYWMGREDGPAEWAIVGDGGQPEVVESNGKAWITPATDTLTYLPANAKVHPSIDDYIEAAQWKAFKPLPIVDDTAVANKWLAQQIVNGVGKLADAVANRPSERTIVTEKGIQKQVWNGIDWDTYLNKYMM